MFLEIFENGQISLSLCKNDSCSYRNEEYGHAEEISCITVPIRVDRLILILLELCFFPRVFHQFHSYCHSEDRLTILSKT